jgi:hypothetical protein
VRRQFVGQKQAWSFHPGAAESRLAGTWQRAMEFSAVKA